MLGRRIVPFLFCTSLLLNGCTKEVDDTSVDRKGVGTVMEQGTQSTVDEIEKLKTRIEELNKITDTYRSLNQDLEAERSRLLAENKRLVFDQQGLDTSSNQGMQASVGIIGKDVFVPQMSYRTYSQVPLYPSRSPSLMEDVKMVKVGTNLQFDTCQVSKGGIKAYVRLGELSGWVPLWYLTQESQGVQALEEKTYKKGLYLKNIPLYLYPNAPSYNGDKEMSGEVMAFEVAKWEKWIQVKLEDQSVLYWIQGDEVDNVDTGTIKMGSILKDTILYKKEGKSYTPIQKSGQWPVNIIKKENGYYLISGPASMEYYIKEADYKEDDKEDN